MSRQQTLQQRFLAEMNGQVLSTKEIFDWYVKSKKDPTVLPDRSVVHRLLIDPLLHRALITKIDHGLYSVDPPAEALRLSKDIVDAEDEWEKYMQAKLGGEA